MIGVAGKEGLPPVRPSGLVGVVTALGLAFGRRQRALHAGAGARTVTPVGQMVLFLLLLARRFVQVGGCGRVVPDPFGGEVSSGVAAGV